LETAAAVADLVGIITIIVVLTFVSLSK